EQLVSGARAIAFLVGFFVIAVVRVVAHIPLNVSSRRGWKQRRAKKSPADDGWALAHNRAGGSARSLDLKLDAAVDRARPLVLLIDQWRVFADACGGHAVRIDSLSRQLAHHGLSAPLTELAIVFIAAGRVSMAFDDNSDIGFFF